MYIFTDFLVFLVDKTKARPEGTDLSKQHHSITMGTVLRYNVRTVQVGFVNLLYGVVFV